MAIRSRDTASISTSNSPSTSSTPRPGPGPSPSPSPAPSPTVSELFDFADALALFSGDVLRYRLKNKATLSLDDRGELEDLEMKLDVQTAQVRAEGIAALGEMTDDDRVEVAGATQDARDFLKRIKKAEKAIAIAAAVLGLAGAIAGRNWKDAGDDARQIRKLTA